MPMQALCRVTLATLASACAAEDLWAHGCLAWAAHARLQSPGATKQSPDPVTQAPEVEPRTRVAGLDSLRVTSSIRFPDPTAPEHRLEMSLAFPARARLALRPVGGEIGQRVLRYARGGELYGFGYREATSTLMEGAVRIDDLLSIEARRAAFVWPEAHAWSGEGTERHALLAGLGALVAELAPTGVSSSEEPAGKDTASAGKDTARDLRPRRIRVLRADGSEVETLEITGWHRLDSREGARAWPQRLRLSVTGELVWDEEVQLIERPFPWPDEWFVPPDRRTPRDGAVPDLRSIDLTGSVVRDVEVPRVAGRSSSIEAALTFARQVAAEESARGRALDRRTILVLSPQLEPQAVRLELADEGALVPEGWRLERPRPAWLLFFDTVEAVAKRDVDRLVAAAPVPPSAEPTLLLVVTGEPHGGVQLMLVDTPR